ncbi:MAG: 50S ribosomal protein L7/L12 [Chlamydiae bacterium RIFCSPHIGHO2_12_FULL_49_11]|nr:MAG: 50S ribosomal protein L7/L12 [Chlamydiae bacterium RIFCSPHIGHO2_12_FULL_49_11]
MNNLVEELSKLTVLDLSKLKQILEEKWDVKAQAAAVAFAAPAGNAAPAAEEAAAEATEFNIILAGSDESKKIAIIKEVRSVTGLGLKEAKEIVEGTPRELKKGVSKSEAEEIKKKLEAAGAKVEVKGV